MYTCIYVPLLFYVYVYIHMYREIERETMDLCMHSDLHHLQVHNICRGSYYIYIYLYVCVIAIHYELMLWFLRVYVYRYLPCVIVSHSFVLSFRMWLSRRGACTCPTPL